MIRGFYSAASGMVAGSIRQDAVSENLAAATVAGYRSRGVTFQTFEDALAESYPSPNANGSLWGTQVGVVYENPAPGPVQYTGNPLDVAPKGDTFIVLEGQGGNFLTRNGGFVINNQGELRSRANGLRVRGEGGPITIPEGAARITIGPEGAVLADGEQVGQIQLVNLPTTNALNRVATTLFEGSAAPSGPIQTGRVRIEQGYLEGSNVQVVNEMVAMIASVRYFEAAQRALRTLSDTIAFNTRPQSAT